MGQDMMSSAQPATGETRPWGGFEVLLDLPHTKVKHLWVQPGHRLSLQRHQHREEHWLVVAGSPEVTIDNRVWRPQIGEPIHIPKGAAHRLSNKNGTAIVEIIETQLGTYFGEDDIERLEDDYQRKAP